MNIFFYLLGVYETHRREKLISMWFVCLRVCLQLVTLEEAEKKKKRKKIVTFVFYISRLLVLLLLHVCVYILHFIVDKSPIP